MLAHTIHLVRVSHHEPAKNGLFLRSDDGTWLAALYDNNELGIETGDKMPTTEEIQVFAEKLVALWNAQPWP